MTNYRRKLFCLSIFAVIYGVVSQLKTEGPCREVTELSDFDLEQFTGIWYDIHRTMTHVGNAYHCTESNITLRADGNVEIVQKSKILFDLFNGTTRSVARLKETNISSSWPLRPVGPLLQSPFEILDTDYTSYAIVYSCVIPYEDAYFEYVWIMARNRHLPEQELDDVLTRARNMNLTLEYIRDVRLKSLCPVPKPPDD